MNLMKSFNFNYLVQNLKKSKAILALFIGIIPILNIIIFLLMAQATDITGLVLSIEELSIINFFGMCIIPIVLSLCLFSFIFKRKSVDFVNSMPLNRKTIFVTNTIGGVAILAAMVLVNVLLITFLWLIFPNIYMPFAMLVDYLTIWVITYIFVFMAANLATSVSGNGITQLVVVALLLLFVPFVWDYTSVKLGTGNSVFTQIVCSDDDCKPINYLCYGDSKCELDKNLNIYHTYLDVSNNYKYVAPYGYLRDLTAFLYYDEFQLFNAGQLIKMIVLSVIYFFVGLFAFNRRKMEVSETSFKNIHVHNIVKCMTMVPIGFLVFEVFDGANVSTLSVLFILAIVLVYYFVYDLITRKSISQIGKGLITFGIAIIIVFGYAEVVDSLGDKQRINKFSVSDIESIAVVPNSYDYTNVGSSKLENTFIENRTLINFVIKYMLTSDKSWDYNSDLGYHNFYELTVILNNKNNRQYKASIAVDGEAYKKIVEILSNDKEYVKKYKDLDYNNIYAVSINNFNMSAKDSKEIINLIKDGMNNLDLYDYYTSFDYGNSAIIELYVYKNHRLETYRISSAINKELNQKIINTANEQLKKALFDSDYVYYDIGVRIESTAPFEKVFNGEYDKFYYVHDNSQSELVAFVKNNVSKSVDISKPYIAFSVWYSGHNYNFYTNDIDALIKLMSERFEYLKTTEDYINMYNNNGEKDYYIE